MPRTLPCLADWYGDEREYWNYIGCVDDGCQDQEEDNYGSGS